MILDDDLFLRKVSGGTVGHYIRVQRKARELIKCMVKEKKRKQKEVKELSSSTPRFAQ